MSKRGSVCIYLKFDVALAHSVNVIVYAIALATYSWFTQTKTNTDQIEQLCRSDQGLLPKLGGVFSRDNLPKLAVEYMFYVSNTDPSPGGITWSRRGLGIFRFAWWCNKPLWICSVPSCGVQIRVRTDS